jgi:hypothetical protein
MCFIVSGYVSTIVYLCSIVTALASMACAGQYFVEDNSIERSTAAGSTLVPAYIVFHRDVGEHFRELISSLGKDLNLETGHILALFL